MTKRILLLACTMLLGGCALPVPVQVASWAIDGLLYITTEKTMVDHGVSIVAQRDCAMLRIVTEGAPCRDDDAATEVAAVTAPAQAPEQPDETMGLQLAAFETAAGVELAVFPPEMARLERVSEEATDRGATTASLEPSVTAGSPEPDATAVLAMPWQTIHGVALFIEGLIEPGLSEALSDTMPTPTPEWTTLVPAAPGDIDWMLHGVDVGLLPVDITRQYADGADIPAVWGGEGEDTLRGATPENETDRDRTPKPVRDNPRLCGGPGHARRRPPLRNPIISGLNQPPPGRRRRRAPLDNS